MIAWQLTIRGRVQRVGYRDAMADVASALGITGWVRNRRDGTVEARVQGDSGAVDQMLAWCARGPSAARVTAIDTIDVDPDPGLEAFERRSSA